MNPETKIAAALNSITALSSKNWPLVAPEGTQPPYAVYQKVSGEGFKSHSSSGGLEKASYQIHIIASAYAQLKELHGAITAALLGMEDGAEMQAVFVDDNAPESYEPSVDALRKTVNFKIIYGG